MIQRVHEYLIQNPVTPSLTFCMLLLFGMQWYVATTSTALFEFLFVGQAKLTLGLIFSPFSHAGITHLLTNIGLLLLFGWLCETKFSRHEFVWFIVVIAYISTFAQILVDTVTVGSAATLGFSGVAYAFPPFYAVVLSPQLRLADLLSQFARPMWVSSAVVSILIPFLLLNLFSFGISGPIEAEPAKTTHAVGFLMGLFWGVVMKLRILNGFSSPHHSVEVKQ